MPYTLRMPEALDVEAIMRHFDDDLLPVVELGSTKILQLTSWPTRPRALDTQSTNSRPQILRALESAWRGLRGVFNRRITTTLL